MTSRERVKRAIAFEGPDRVPVVFHCFGESDIEGMGPGGEASPKHTGENLDEFGCRWDKVDEDKTGIRNMGQVKGHPIKTRDDLLTYEWPDFTRPERMAHIPEQLAAFEAQEKYVFFGLGNTLLERAWMMRGMEELFLDMIEDPTWTHELLGGIFKTRWDALNQLAPYAGRIDAIYWGDDWGTQNALLISLPMFREFYKPLYAKLFARAQEFGMANVLHSCGQITEVIDDFLEIGLHVVDMEQPKATGIDMLSKRFQGRICFLCPVDIQRTLPYGTKEEIEAEAKELIEKLGTPKGGFIASDYANHPAIGVPDEKVFWSYEAFKRYGVYKA